MKNELKTAPRLFDNAFLEKLTHTNSKVAITIYVATAMGVLVYGLSTIPTTFIQVFVLFNTWPSSVYLGGVCMLHRYVYHSGKYDQPTEWQFKIHGVHHKHPKGRRPTRHAYTACNCHFGQLLFSVLLYNGVQQLLFLPWLCLGICLLPNNALFDPHA